MTSPLEVALTAAVALFFFGMGAYALVWPAKVLAHFGVRVESAEGRNEVSAVYGGFGIAVALLLAYAAYAGGDAARAFKVAIAIALLGMASGRVLAFFRERPARVHPTVTFLLVELALAAALWLP